MPSASAAKPLTNSPHLLRVRRLCQLQAGIRQLTKFTFSAYRARIFCGATRVRLPLYEAMPEEALRHQCLVSSRITMLREQCVLANHLDLQLAPTVCALLQVPIEAEASAGERFTHLYFASQ